MLVLTRCRGEEIIITDGNVTITVEVIQIRNDKVRIGVTAPQSMEINRKEVMDRPDYKPRSKRLTERDDGDL